MKMQRQAGPAASFPIALACAAAEGEDPAPLSGEIYGANTAGAIAGALLFSLVLIPAIGTRGVQETLIGISVAAALVSLMASAQLKTLIRAVVAGAAAILIGALLISTVL